MLAAIRLHVQAIKHLQRHLVLQCSHAPEAVALCLQFCQVEIIEQTADLGFALVSLHMQLKRKVCLTETWSPAETWDYQIFESFALTQCAGEIGERIWTKILMSFALANQWTGMCAAQLRTYVMSSIHVWTSGKISLLQSFAARATLIARSGALHWTWLGTVPICSTSRQRALSFTAFRKRLEPGKQIWNSNHTDQKP